MPENTITATDNAPLSINDINPSLLGELVERATVDPDGKPPVTPETPEGDAAQLKTEEGLDEQEAEEDAETEDDGDDTAETPETAETRTVKLGEREFTLPKADADYLEQGFLLRQDYTAKTTEIAEGRRALEAAAKTMQDQFTGLRSEYAERLTQLYQQIAPSEKVDWEKLRQEDPHEYLLKRDAEAENERKRATLQAEFERTRLEQQTQFHQQMRNIVAAEKGKLLEAVPEFRDEEVARREGREIQEYLLKNKFTEDEVAQLYDHRYMLMVRKAMNFDRATSAKTQLENKAKVLPKVTKPGTAQTGKRGNQTLIQRAMRSGRQADAAAVFTALED